MLLAYAYSSQYTKYSTKNYQDSQYYWGYANEPQYRVPKLAVLYLSAYFLFLELHPFTLSKMVNFPSKR